MIKFRTSICLNLLQLLLLELASLIFMSVVEVHPASGQSMDYSCQPYQGGYATVARSSRGTRAIINWGDQQSLCHTVSANFQVASENGNLRYLVVENNNVCGTNTYGGECRTLLFSTDIGISFNDFLRRLINGPINTAINITQSNGREYFGLELYLNISPIPSNIRNDNQLP